MSRTVRPSQVLLRISALGVVALVAAAGCAKSGPAPVAGAAKIRLALTSAGCGPSASTVPAGPVTFNVTNKNTASVTEVELLQPDATILAEKEAVAPGLSGTFSASLKPGDYKLYCPGGNTSGYTTLTVTGASAAGPANPAQAAALATGTAAYTAYIKTTVADFVAKTRIFTNAVRADNLAAAAAAYPAPRVDYERMEPVAESFTSPSVGNLDAQIDMRIADVTPGTPWSGYHRLEKAVFADRSLAGMTPVANTLDADVGKLQALVATKTFQPAVIDSGAVELLNEIGRTKITGEEERYSLLDLVDFKGNVDGAEQAFAALEPGLKMVDPGLVTEVTQRFAALDKVLTGYSTGPAPTDYVTYDKVPVDQHKVLSQLVDAVAEPLAQVGGKVVSS